MDLGPHAVFIWLCYGAVAVVMAGLIAALLVDGVRLRRELAELESLGDGRPTGAGHPSAE